ncbi:PREDICTED: cubilin-like [Acropora digitifera]|uniref:cubilin-like n=1 Tax=Acropora digitifera TaxID=70779 RepID=UPI000779F6A6|nr:PREDICTED: cubilin-like [Acropora digitifera]
MKGTFHSPNYPSKHSDGEYCSWKIPGNRIRLTFSSPSFHKHNGASNLIVYDGEHVSGEVLGVFYGSPPPPGKEFYSSSNHMLVIFVSNATDSYTGFNASYNFIERRDPIKWPAGTYGIPKPKTGCPSSDGFQWMTGSRSQDTNNDTSKNNKSASFHLDAVVDKKKVKRSFCLKTSTAKDQNRNIWPSGQYCIYKKGSCPDGLNDGFVYWDDDDNDNKNNKSGTLPDGDYNRNTKIEFCCRTDGNENEPVVLPTKEQFYLLAYEFPRCQMVKWTVSSLEWIYYDTEDSNNNDHREWAFPYNAATQHPTIYYCYYRGCNKTLTAMNGTFHSPNYPNKHSDGEYCSWKISVSAGNRIRLTFSNPSFHKQDDASNIIVYDGENVSGEVLGVFHGSLPPPGKEFYSSSNHMLVVFESKATDSYTGFNASYNFIERRATDPIKWPAGTYGIPKPVSGCPVADGFQWMTGSRSQHTESNNKKSVSFHLDAVVNKKKVKRSFCLKTSTAEDQNRTTWPSGQYCIYKKGNCPEHLNYGFVYWDDDDTYDNKNSKSGTLPDGVYNTDTEIEFCCRTDGNKDRPVALPTQEPFYLLAYKLPRCQMVKWAVSRLEWIYYDTDDWSNRDNRGGVFPYNAATQHPTIYYCYYRG